MPREGSELVLCRTRAAAQDRLRARSGELVWTVGDLFERLASWGALRAKVRRDDLLARVLAARALARPAFADDGDAAADDGDAAADDGAVRRSARSTIRPRLVPALDALRREFVHARTSAAALLTAAGADVVVPGDEQGRRAELRQVLLWVAEVEATLQRTGVVDEALALELARRALVGGRRPGFLRGIGSLRVELPVDATALQAATLAALARHVDVVVTLPVDPVPGRGALDGLDDVFRSFERDDDGDALTLETVDVVGDGPLAPLRRSLFGAERLSADEARVVAVRVLPDEHAELAFVASAVAARRAAEPGARIAVVARSEEALDPIAAALERQGLPVRRRRRRLLDSPAARLLVDVVTLRLDGAPRDRLLSALVSVARRGGLTGEQGAGVLATLRRAAARRDVEDASRPEGGYRHRLERLVLRDAAARPAVDRALLAIEPLLRASSSLPQPGTLSAQLVALLALVDDVIDVRGRFGGAEVREVVARLAAGVERGGSADPSGERTIDLHATLHLVQAELAAQPWIDDLVEAPDDAVEVLGLPELCGRRFAHLAIVRAVEGELPRAALPQGFLGDGDRAALNRALGRRALRLADDAAAVGGRGTGIEGAWWLLGLQAATDSVLVTAASSDGRGRDRAPSAWLLDVARALGCDPEALVVEGQAGAEVATLVPPRTRTVQAARAIRAGEQGSFDADLVAAVRLAAQMADERARFFAAAAAGDDDDDEAVGSPSASWRARRAPFAFAVDGRRVARVFGTAFGLRPERPLTPTRLEALAECRMHGFVQHVLKLDVDPEPGNAIEVRAAGTMAHNALERFFRERRARRVPSSRMNADDRARLAAIVDDEAAPMLAGSATGHLAALAASVAFWKATLVRVVTQLARHPPVDGVEPAAFEMQIGTTQGGRAPELGSVPVQVAPGRTIWLGGVIDRVDEGPGRRAVVDYKSAAGARIRKKAASAELLQTHFQLLVYLRLLEHHRPTAPSTTLHGTLVSLKDGVASADIGALAELRARIVDDDRDDGLARSIGRVVLPILDGTLPPDAGGRCEDCRLLRVCRVPMDGVLGRSDGDGSGDGDGDGSGDVSVAGSGDVSVAGSGDVSVAGRNEGGSDHRSGLPGHREDAP